MQAILKSAFILLLVCASAAFAAALAGTGCTQPSGDCVVNTSQTIDSGTTYYFNSLTINQGAGVTIASTPAIAGGTVKFYVANDINIAGSISAIAPNNAGTSSTDGGGYAGAVVSGCSYGYVGGGGGGSGGAAVGATGYPGGAGGGVISLYAKRINIASTGSISANGGTGTSSYAGGGSGGTITLVAKTINLSGSMSAQGGTGSALGGGCGAGGSLIFMPLTITSLSGGSMNFNGGTGGGGGAGGGSGGPGGNGQCGDGGSANANRNIRIYNSYVPSGSGFTIASGGSSAGLLDLYNSPYNSKYAALSATQKTQNLFFGTFSRYFYPYSGIQASFVNASNRSQVFMAVTTGSDGTMATTATLPGTYDIVVDLPAQNSYAYLASSSQQDHSAFALQAAATHAVFYPRAINFAVFTPDGIQKAYYPYTLNSSDGIYCAGNTSATQDSTCIAPKNGLDNTLTRLNYSLVVPANAYSKNPYMDWLQAPSVFYVSGGAPQKLRGLATTTVARTGQTIKRTVIYTPTQTAEKDFAYTETIPSDFAFGAVARATMALSDGSELDCTFAPPATGKLITFSAANCPILSTQLTNGNWLKLEFDIVTPQPDAFFGEYKDYSFSQGSLQLNSFTS
ncbi:MAG: hypothetical protein WC506_03065 [Candidatus Micrarchaeia archaeon]